MADEPLVEGSPLGDPNAIEDLQHSSQTIHTSSPTRPDTAVAALTFTASDTAPATTNKHHLTHNNPRIKKKADNKHTPVPSVSFAPNVKINDGNDNDDMCPPNIRRGNDDSLQLQYMILHHQIILFLHLSHHLLTTIWIHQTTMQRMMITRGLLRREQRHDVFTSMLIEQQMKM